MAQLLFIFTLIATVTQSLSAQQKPKLAGDWKGTIDNPTVPLLFKTHFQKQDNGFKGTLDIQGTTLPLQNISATGADSISFEFKTSVNVAKFKGILKNDSTIAGHYEQAGYKFPFEMHRYKPKTDSTQAQKNIPLPYNHKDLIIKNDSIKIGGTLTWPKDQQAHQLVIMISGSGAQDRDEAIPVTDFKPFAVLADSLTNAGIATFRYDDRGVGKSTGNFANATLGILASDVKAIISYFKNQSDQPFDRIILLGHSQGGEVAGKTAAEDTRVDRLILMSSPGISLKKVLHYQVKQGFLSEGIADSTAEDEIMAREKLMKAIHTGKDVEKAKKVYQVKFQAIQLGGGVDSTRAEALADHQTKLLTQVFESPQMKSLLFYDPTEDLSKLKIPVLALFGGKDTQVLTGKNKAPIKAALEKAGVPFQIKTVRNANHLYQHAKTGQVGEYATLPNRFVEGFLETIEQWLTASNERK